MNESNALTPREIEVLKLVAQSVSTKDIASQLRISHRTVEAHRANIRRKLNLKDAAAFARFAIRKGLVQLD